MSQPSIVAALDFKSSESYLAFHARGAAHAVARDYVAELVPLEWEDKASLLPPGDGASAIEKRTHAYAVGNYERYRALHGLPAPASAFGEHARPTRALLAGLRVARRRGAAAALRYIAAAFDAYADPDADIELPAGVEALLNRSGVAAPPGSVSHALAEAGEAPIRATDVLDASLVLRPPSFRVGSVASVDHFGLSMARLHLELAGAKKRRPDVVPDVPCLGPSSHLPPDAPGMPLGPTRRALLAAYDAHSLRPEHPTPETAVDMYVDVKSPHAYLAVDIFRSLERDFRVRLRTRPFDIALDRIYGDAVSAPVPKPGSKVPPPTSNRARHQGRPQRTEAQWKNVKWTYADLRRLAGLRGITVFGQEKVWDSRLAIMAVAFSERYGRRAQDRYVDEAYRRTWRRELDLEDAGAIADLVAWAAGRPDAREAFLAYAAPDGPGWSELAAVQAEAEGLGIWGVPAFVVGGEMYWGKDQVPLVRKKLLEMGLARHGGVGAEVPYLWRPAEEEGGKGKL